MVYETAAAAYGIFEGSSEAMSKKSVAKTATSGRPAPFEQNGSSSTQQGLTGAHALTLPGGWEPDSEGRGQGAEHRQFPRARFSRRFELWVDVDGDRRFSASFASRNLSVSGAFLDSSFFLPLGTEVRVRFTVGAEEEQVEARGVIVREERPERSGEGRSGFGIRFDGFFGQSEVALAKVFLGVQLRAFAAEYLASKRARGLDDELERVVDTLAAWELLKVTGTPHDPWSAVEA